MKDYRNRSIELIRQLSNAPGPSGFEGAVVEVVRENAEQIPFETDKLKNCYLGEITDKNFVMLDSHSDEVGFIVRFIEENGMIAFLPLGGWLENGLPAHLVMVRGKDRYHKGIIVNKPIHFTDPSERDLIQKIDDLRIDMGAYSRTELIEELGIKVGTPIVPFSEFEYRADKGILMGKAFDNRLGSAAVIETMRRLYERGEEEGVVGAIAAQEEVGGRGAEVTARRVNPEYAIVFEGSPADDTFLPIDRSQCRLGGGPMVRHYDGSYISDEYLISLAEEVAAEKGMPLQHAVRKGSGTDAGIIHKSNLGTPCLVISVPSRYIHSHYQYASIEDFENAVELAVGVIKKLKRI